MRHPRHRPPNRPYRTPGRSLPYAPQARAAQPPFAFEAHPNADLIARVVRPHDGHEVTILQAPRNVIGDGANFGADLYEDATTLVVAVEYIDDLVHDALREGLSEPDATRRAIEHLVGLAADILRVRQ